MRIHDVEIQNFRRLRSVRLEFDKQTTFLVGANNSGKTSAMVALRRFLTKDGWRNFTPHDFTAAHWASLQALGRHWESVVGDPDVDPAEAPTPPARLEDILPTLDLWLYVEDSEFHRVIDVIPTLSWSGGLLGLRLRLEPRSHEDLMREYTEARRAAVVANAGEAGEGRRELSLWPTDLLDFLSRRLSKTFHVVAYALDPAARQDPANGIASPQLLPAGSEPLEGNPLAGLVRVDEISAQRGLEDEPDSSGAGPMRENRRLSEHLRAYYSRHLDPTDHPDPSDLEALRAIEEAEAMFDERLKTSFERPLQEVSGLGYPGVSDPRVTVSTQLRPVDGLSHSSAVQYEVEIRSEGEASEPVLLPERFNGLGFQNLIMMTFRLMSFRDAWMRVGKAGAGGPQEAEVIEPLHLVLVEEPEAHLHAQVQQVFTRKAFDVLRNHDDLGDAELHVTQLIVSTHSSHVAHEAEYSSLRYFQRLPAGANGVAPTSCVVNLACVFGTESTTDRFVKRYLRIHHCDLFFADAAILVEGSAERMLLPLFLRRSAYQLLGQSYLSIHEVGGSHAHRLRPLIEALGLMTLIITDLDALGAAPEGGGRRRAELPARNADQITSNQTLKTWLPCLEPIDALLDASDADKARVDDRSAVRVTYQSTVSVDHASLGGDVTPYTFEDALVFENLSFFAEIEDGTELTRKVREAIRASGSLENLRDTLFQAIRADSKAAFALDVISDVRFEALQVPGYIRDGLDWLQGRLDRDITATAVLASDDDAGAAE